jgi:hypothetical protein
MEKLDQLQNVIQEYNDRLTHLKTEVVAQFEDSLKYIFKLIFEEYQDVERIVWVQYTPYFNDGDPCVFGYRSLDVYPFGFSETQEAQEEGLDGTNWYGDYSPTDKYPLLTQMDNIFQESEDLLLFMFGDHVQITVTRDGLTVEGYEHD